MTGFILFAHGSRIESANEAVRIAASRLAEAGGLTVEPAFLELGVPDLSGAVGRLASSGIAQIVVLPYFLTLGTHMQRDLPKLAEAASLANGGVNIRIAPTLDGHPALIDLLLDRARSATAGDPA